MNYARFLILLGIVALPQFAVSEEEGSSGSGTYHWVDDNGTVNFTDDPMNIPAKKLNKVRKRSSVQGSVTRQSATQENVMPAARVPQLSPMRYGGHDEMWWRRRFDGLKSQIRSITDALPEKETRLRELHFKKVTSNSMGMSPGVSGNPRRRKTAYLDHYAEIQSDKERLANLESELENLKREAAGLGVPLAWQ